MRSSPWCCFWQIYRWKTYWSYKQCAHIWINIPQFWITWNLNVWRSRNCCEVHPLGAALINNWQSKCAESQPDFKWQGTQRIGAATPRSMWLRRSDVRSAVRVINVAGWLRNSVQPGWTFPLPLSLVWLSHAVTYCLSLTCLMVDANWPPFPLSSAQMKRFPWPCDGACHNTIRQIKKLSAVTLSSFEALVS